MKKVFSLIACSILALLMIVLPSCDTLSKLDDAVKYPEFYTLAYEVTTSDGKIFTVAKTVDRDGNVYYKNAEKEAVYILDGSGFIKYEKGTDGSFAKASEVKLTKEAVKAEVSDINDYAEQSKNKLMPTAKQEADAEILGRVCEVYKLGVGNDSNSSYTYYYVDKESGICLKLETKNIALNTEVPHNEENFVCTEFSVDNVIKVAELIEK